MNDQIHKFVGRHGTLIVKPEGITVKRTWSQALQNGRLINRNQTISYDALKDVKQKHIDARSGYLQLTTKPGTAHTTPFNRHTKLKFDAHQAHQFRQAQKLIEDRLEQLQSIETPTSHQPTHIPQDPLAS